MVSGRRNSSRDACFQPVSAEHGHRDDGVGEHPVRLVPRGHGPALALGRVAIGGFAREVRELVVQVLGGCAHHRGALVDQAVGDEAGVEVDFLAHRVMTHVLDAAGDRDVVRAHRDVPCDAGDGGQGTCAHPVDRKAGNGVWQAGEERDAAAEREALVADLGGGCDGDVADPFGRQLRVPSQKLTDDLRRHVVGARLREHPAGLPERGSHPVHEDDVVCLAPHLARIAGR